MRSRHRGRLRGDSHLASQIDRPAVVLPILASAFAAPVTGNASLSIATIHLATVFFGVAPLLVEQSRVDQTNPGVPENATEQNSRSSGGSNRWLVPGVIAATGLGFGLCLAAIWVTVDAIALVLILPTWGISVVTVRGRPTSAVARTTLRPLLVGLAFVGSAYAQAGALGATPAALAAVGFVLLVAVELLGRAARTDRELSTGDHALVRYSGPYARRLGLWSLGLAFVGVLWATLGGPLPPSAPFVVAWPAAVAVLVRAAPPTEQVNRIAYATWIALGLLVVVVVTRPLASVPLPDIGILGPYTYLATEIAFGLVAFGLLLRAGREAVTSAGRTIAMVYPLAYVWDWYSLEVGIFSIPLRTGVELVGIPLEEHLFMVVVPALVLGVHETLRAWDESTEQNDSENPKR